MTESTVLKINDSTYQELSKIKGAIKAETGKEVTDDELIVELVKVWKTAKDKSPEHIGETQVFY